MCAALRYVGVASLKPQHELLLSRWYPNVEQRYNHERGQPPKQQPAGRTIGGPVRVPLPKDSELLQEIVRAWMAASDDELADRVYVHARALWPVVCLERDDHLFIAIPLASVEDKAAAASASKSIHHVEITIALTFLQDLAAFSKQLFQEDSRELVEKIADLNLHLNFAAPFGQLQDVPLGLARAMSRYPPPGDKQATTAQKLPSWKPYLVRGKNQINLIFREEISAAQYDLDGVPDTWQVNGTVVCKADLEGSADVTVALQSGSVGKMTTISVHPCVQAEELTQTKNFMFSPPMETFTLCHYRVTDVPYLPLRGFFQMKEIDDSSVRILLQLKLDERVHNNFEYCQVNLPFSHRGTIAQVDLSPTTGIVSLSPNKQSLIWNIGQRFTGRNREVALPGTVYFVPDAQQQPQLSTRVASPQPSFASPRKLMSPPTARATYSAGTTSTSDLASESDSATTTSYNTVSNANDVDSGSVQMAIRHSHSWGGFEEPDENTDLFCARGETSYVNIRFKLIEDNMSGCTVDAQSVVAYPNRTVKVTSQRELVSNRYIIWNSKGDVRHALPSPSPLVPL